MTRMLSRVLVAYASKMGATKEIANAIGARLTERGVLAEVRPVDTVDTIEGYDAVVLGSAVYAGRWRPEAIRFCRRQHRALTRRPVWLFESGWLGERPAEFASAGGRRRANWLGARPPVVFGGRLDPALAMNLMDRMVARRMPGDARDWTAIRAWADDVADQLDEALAGRNEAAHGGRDRT